MSSHPPVPLSIVIATRSTWPHLAGCLDALVDQAHAVNAEIIVADGNGAALPETRPPAYAGIVWFKAPGAGAFRLRGLAVAQARGEIIAITEDHCVARRGWCAEILRAHADHPLAAAVGGAVENGSTQHLADWAGFLIANGPFMLPLQNGERAKISLQANISYKRRALKDADRGLGLMEMLFNQELRARSEALVADDRIVVDHNQSLSLPTFSVLHFHNGRCIAGFRLERMRAVERVARLGGCVILPPYMLARTLWTVVTKRRLLGLALASVPFMIVMLVSHAVGECVGYIRGAGDSQFYKHLG